MPKQPGAPRKLTAFRLSDEEMRKLERLAAVDERTKSDVIRDLINNRYKRVCR